MEKGSAVDWKDCIGLGLRPRPDGLIVRVSPDQSGVEKKWKKDSPILCPDSAKTKPHYGYVVKVGSELLGGWINAGDFVIFGFGAGSRTTMGDAEYAHLKESSVLTVVEDQNIIDIYEGKEDFLLQRI